jgi:hypothetical protein
METDLLEQCHTVNRDISSVWKSCRLLSTFNCPLIRLQVDITGIPDCHGLHKHTLLLSLLDVSDHVNPCTNVELMALDSLQHMFDIDICDNWWARSGAVVLEAQSRCLDDVLVNAVAY